MRVGVLRVKKKRCWLKKMKKQRSSNAEKGLSLILIFLPSPFPKAILKFK